MVEKSRIDVNPFFTYIYGFLIALIVYTFDWSYLYPKLSVELVLFFIASFGISLGIGLFFYHKKYFVYRKFSNQINVKLFYALIILGFIAEFAYARNIPFVAIITNSGYDYISFGIPTFHVILITFTGFFTLQMFNTYMATDEKKYLYICLSLFIFPVLIFSRGTFLVNLSSILFLYLFSTKRNKVKIYLTCTGIVLIVLLLFGVLGNIRTQNQQTDIVDDVNQLVLSMGGAKPEFVDSAIPKEYFWAYLYISSPLANLQYNIDHNKGYDYSFGHFFEYANSQLNYDFISKRIDAISGMEPLGVQNIDEHWMVATAYSHSYSYLGWLGIITSFCFFMGVSVLYLLILKPGNPYFATGVAILNTMLLFGIFDNMFSFSGLSFQLLYPLIMQIRFKSKN